jgi:hypothetical protein
MLQLGQQGGKPMKAFLAAVLVAGAIAGGAYAALGTVQQPVEVAFSTAGVRL